MANTIKCLFWIHRSKINKNGECPLKIRLTYNTWKIDRSSGYLIRPTHWNTNKQRVKSNTSKANNINDWIETSLNRVSKAFAEEVEGGNIELSTIMNKVFIQATKQPSLLATMQSFNVQMKSRLNKDYAFSTYEKYVFTYNKVKSYCKDRLAGQDILLKDLTTKFIMDFDHYLRVNDNNKHNTAIKYCLNLKRILNVAVMEGLLLHNPFNQYKTVYKDIPQIYLNQKELQIITSLPLIHKKHFLVRDLFTFQCHTGLAYTDMISLTRKDITVDRDGISWIIKPRQKTGILSTIPLLNTAKDILLKYSSEQREKLLPRYSIQKYNQYLKEIGILAGMAKNLSSHVGRRTFGNIALEKGISLNVISKILGHSNTIITQRIYAITTQKIISNEIHKW